MFLGPINYDNTYFIDNDNPYNTYYGWLTYNDITYKSIFYMSYL
jgi:hypothetical protein